MLHTKFRGYEGGLGFAPGNSMPSRYLHLGENILNYCLLKHEITV